MNYQLWVGSYRAKKEEPGIHELLVNTNSKTVTVTGQHSGVENPSYLAESEGYLYATSETMDGKAVLFQIKNEDLLLKDSAEAGEIAPCHIYAEGTYAWTANYGGSVTQYERLGDSLMKKAFSKHKGVTGPHERQDNPHVHAVIPFPDGKHLLACDHGTDTLVVYDKQSLTMINEVKTAPGSGPRTALFHREKPVLYVMNELHSSVSVYRIEESSTLVYLNTFSALPDGYGGRHEGSGLQFSSDGCYLYAAVRYWDGLAIFRMEEDGSLSPPHLLKLEGKTPRSFYALEKEPYVIIAYQDSHEVWLYEIEESGFPVFTGSRVSVPHPACVIMKGEN